MKPKHDSFIVIPRSGTLSAHIACPGKHPTALSASLPNWRPVFPSEAAKSSPVAGHVAPAALAAASRQREMSVCLRPPESLSGLPCGQLRLAAAAGATPRYRFLYSRAGPEAFRHLPAGWGHGQSREAALQPSPSSRTEKALGLCLTPTVF